LKNKGNSLSTCDWILPSPQQHWINNKMLICLDLKTQNLWWTIQLYLGNPLD
jgi:hypothetical protein